MQINQIKDHICSCENKSKPLNQKKLVIWINETFNTKTSASWVMKNLLNNLGIFYVDAEPLEQTRLKVKEEDLRANAAEMAVKISNVDPRFIFNADETSIDSTKETKKKSIFT